MEHWYVYYTLEADALAAWLPRAEVLLAAVEAASGVRGRLLRRTDEAPGRAFGAALQAALARAVTQAPALASPARHTERFRPLAAG
jgi:hypothetical protein